MKSGCFQNGDLHLESTLLFLSLILFFRSSQTHIDSVWRSFLRRIYATASQTYELSLVCIQSLSISRWFRVWIAELRALSSASDCEWGCVDRSQMQIWQSWNRFSSAIWPFWTRLWCISPIWRDFGLSRLELVRFSMLSPCILWVETEMKWNVDLPMLDTIQFLTNSAFMVKTIIFTSLYSGRR